MPRFFRRRRVGVFDEDDLRARTDELAAFVEAAGAEHGAVAGSWYAVGFSNGANIASALLLRHPGLLAGAVLFAGDGALRRPARCGPDRQAGRHRERPARSDGDPDLTERLAAQLGERGAEIVEIPHSGGHTIDPAGVARIAELLAERR